MFKIGDKVRVLHNPKWRHGDGTIIDISGSEAYVHVKFDVSVCVLCSDAESCNNPINSKWYKITNIEHVVKKKQQLVFDFML